MGNKVVVTPSDFNHVHESPKRLLCESIKPGSLAKQVYHLKMAKQIRTRQHDVPSTVVYASDQAPFAVSIKGGQKGLFAKNNKMFLTKNEDNSVIAVMIHDGNLKFKIYSFQPQHEGQVPSKERQNGQDLYLWAKVESVGFEQVCMWVQNDATYVAEGDGIRGMQVRRARKTCATVRSKIHFWDVTIGPGIDPSLFVCFLAIIDEMIQIRLRLQMVH